MIGRSVDPSTFLCWIHLPSGGSVDHGLGSSRVRISWSLFMGSCLLLHGELGMISVWFMGLGLGFMGSGLGFMGFVGMISLWFMART